MKTLMILITAALAGCANSPTYDRAVSLMQTGDPEDVKFCKYEATKAPAYSNDGNMLIDAVEVQRQRLTVFNACMDYRRK